MMSPTRTYRRLLYVWVGLLCVGVLAQAALAVFLVQETNARQEDDAAQIAQNEATVEVLCDRAYLIADLIIATEDFVAQQQPPLEGAERYLRTIDVHYRQLIDEVTDPKQPCARP